MIFFFYILAFEFLLENGCDECITQNKSASTRLLPENKLQISGDQTTHEQTSDNAVGEKVIDSPQKQTKKSILSSHYSKAKTGF